MCKESPRLQRKPGNVKHKSLKGAVDITEFEQVISTGDGGKRMHAQDLIFDKKNKIIAQCKSVLDKMSAVLSFGAGLPENRQSTDAACQCVLGILRLFPGPQ